MMVCCETRTTIEVMEESKKKSFGYGYLQLFGYRAIHLPFPFSKKNQTKGGIVFYIHDSLSRSKYNHIQDLGYHGISQSTQSEYIWIEIGGRKWIIGALYLHPTHVGGSRLIRSIRNASRYAADRGYMFLCGGDMNCHISEYGDKTNKRDVVSQMLIDTIDSCDMICLNDKYDRDQCTFPSSRAQLDLVFSSENARIQGCRVGVAMIGDGPLMSDHLPITVTLYNDHVPTRCKVKKEVWDVEKGDIEGLQQFLSKSLSTIHIPLIPFPPSDSRFITSALNGNREEGDRRLGEVNRSGEREDEERKVEEEDTREGKEQEGGSVSILRSTEEVKAGEDRNVEVEEEEEEEEKKNESYIDTWRHDLNVENLEKQTQSRNRNEEWEAGEGAEEKVDVTDIGEMRKLIERIELDMRNRIIEGCEMYIPKKEVKHNRKRWFNYRTEQGETMDRCYEKYAKIKHKYKSNSNIEEYRIEYEEAKKEWEDIVLSAKRKAWMEMVNRVTREGQGKILLWNEFKKTKPSDYHPCIEVNNADGSHPISPLQSVNTVASAFASVSSVLDDSDASINAKGWNIRSIGDAVSKIHPHLCKKYTINELKNAMKKMKKKTSCGPDGIHTWMLIAGGDELLRVLLDIYNYSWIHGVVPKIWRRANVHALLKPHKDPHLAFSFRPISVTSILIRLFERMIKARLSPYLDANNILSDEQMGFREGRCTHDHLYRLHRATTKAIRENENLPVVFIDIKAAFDRVWLEGLYYKLYKAGIHGNALRWIMEFTSGRQIRVVAANNESDWHDLYSGVPQGCVLSPTLFLVYINDVTYNEDGTSTIHGVVMALYADDICIWPIELGYGGWNYMIDALELISQWAKQWIITFSMDKTRILCFRRKGKTIITKEKFYLCDQPILGCKVYKYLGLHFEQSLNWREHEKDVIKRTKTASALVARMMPRDGTITVMVAKELCNALILSIIDYGIAIWCPTSEKNWDKLTSLYLSPMRKALGLPFSTHRNSICVELGILRLEIWRDTRIIMETQRLTNKNMALVREDVDLNITKMGNNIDPFNGSIRYRNIITDGMAVRDTWNLPLDISNPQMNTSRKTIRQKAREEMCREWKTKLDGSLYGLHLDDMTTPSHRNGMAYYLTQDTREVARARARFRFNRAMTNKVRQRLHDKHNSKDCNHPLCIQESKRMEEEMILIMDEEEKEDRQPYRIEHNRKHVLLECPQYEEKREQTIARIRSIRPEIPLSIELLLACNDHNWNITGNEYRQILDATGVYLVWLDKELENDGIG